MKLRRTIAPLIFGIFYLLSCAGKESNNLSDKEPPVITLQGSATIDISIGSEYLDDGAAAIDNIDGEISDKIIINNPVDTNKVGSYIVTYNVSDNSGNAAEETTRTVNVTNPNNWTNEFAKREFKETALSLCSDHNPEYLGLGIEVNTYYYYNPDDFIRYASFYKELYDDIKEDGSCPDAKIFVTFHLERLKGLGTGVGYSGEPQWDIFQLFDNKLDLIVFTTYPEFEYTDPNLMPDDYYTSIYDNLPDDLKDKKIGFSEIGWNSSQNLLPDANNTIGMQESFIARFDVLIESLRNDDNDNDNDIEFVTWIFMHDFQIGDFMVASSMGLKENNGDDKEIDPGDTMVDHFLQLKTFSGLTIGVAPIPRNFPNSDQDDYLDMYGIVNGQFDLITAQTDWRDSVEESGKIPKGLQDYYNARELYSVHDAKLLYGIGFFDLADGEALLTMPDIIE